jgi:hypothetical protein
VTGVTVHTGDTRVVLPDLPDGFEWVTTIRHGALHLQLRDGRDLALAKFKRDNAVKDNSLTDKRLPRYGVAVLDAEVKNRRQLLKKARNFAEIAWLADAASDCAGDAP